MFVFDCSLPKPLRVVNQKFYYISTEFNYIADLEAEEMFNFSTSPF